jgi:hypothetical protein
MGHGGVLPEIRQPSFLPLKGAKGKSDYPIFAAAMSFL